MRFYARVERIPETILRLENAKRAVEGLRGVVHKVGEDAEIIFAAYAPKDTGRLARGISSTPSGSMSAIVRAHAREPKSGYDYVGVTRFGHRVARIYPAGVARSRFARNASTSTSQLLGGRNRRYSVKYPHFIARSVKGYDPSGDWRDKALPTIEREAEMAMRQLARQIEATT